MNIKELINYLETAQQKLGPDTEVVVGIITVDGEEMEIQDIVMKGQSLVNVNLNSDEAKVIIKF